MNGPKYLPKTGFSRRVQLDVRTRKTMDPSKRLQLMRVYPAPGEARNVDIMCKFRLKVNSINENEMHLQTNSFSEYLRKYFFAKVNS